MSKAQLTLLYADTLQPNTTPHSVHEIRFRRPVILHAFRIVRLNESPHPEISFEGGTPATQLTIELFGCQHGEKTMPKSGLCSPLLDAPHLRQELSIPSSMHELNSTSTAMQCNYVVIRCVRRRTRF